MHGGHRAGGVHDRQTEGAGARDHPVVPARPADDKGRQLGHGARPVEDEPVDRVRQREAPRLCDERAHAPFEVAAVLDRSGERHIPAAAETEEAREADPAHR